MKARQNITAIAYDKKGRVLSVGKNSYLKTHPLQAKYAKGTTNPKRVFLHAEIAALVKARAPIHKLVIIRIGKDGTQLPSAPCECCVKAIRDFNIQEVIYT